MYVMYFLNFYVNNYFMPLLAFLYRRWLQNVPTHCTSTWYQVPACVWMDIPVMMKGAHFSREFLNYRSGIKFYQITNAVGRGPGDNRQHYR